MAANGTTDPIDDRLGASLARAKEIVSALPDPRRSHFTSATATAANAKKYAGVSKKPATATVRVEADVLELVKRWPTSERVAKISEAIRAAFR